MKYLIAVILGFVVHKGLEELYDYSWYQAYERCVKEDCDAKTIDCIERDFACTKDKMGPAHSLKFLLARPRWFDGDHTNDWTY